MTLGKLFPQGMREQAALTRFVPGSVIYLHCPFTKPPKPKYLVVACVNPLLVLVINSEVHPFVQRNPHLANCQVPVPATDHAFLAHDSYADCVDTQTAFNYDHVRAQIEADPHGIVKGILSEACIRDVIAASNGSLSMERRHQKLITAALNQSLADYQAILAAFP